MKCMEISKENLYIDTGVYRVDTSCTGLAHGGEPPRESGACCCTFLLVTEYLCLAKLNMKFNMF